jgi:hypothetical protein
MEVTMKMVKSLLLGGAAGLVAIAGAQAADLPVKAKPVEYVKVCSLYGEGFFYIPGTDTCIKIGGWVRYDAYFNTGGSGQTYIASGSAGRNDRIDSADFQQRARWVISEDVRTQTEYGTLRAYARAGYELTTADGGNRGLIYAERGFIQFAGFTFGKTESYFDFAAHAWGYGAFGSGGGSDTGGQGILVAAYTANLGNGVTLTIAEEDGFLRRTALWDASSDGSAAGAFPSGNGLAIGAMPGPGSGGLTTSRDCGANLVAGDNTNGNANTTGGLSIGSCQTGDYAAQSLPDFVAALRVDQAWGSAQIMGAIHQVRGGFYGNNFVPAAGSFTGMYPSDKYGFAVGAGIVWNLPWNPGDKFWVEGEYTQGAVSYTGLSCLDGLSCVFNRYNGANVAAGWALDGVFANNAVLPFSGIQLATAWDVAVAVEHYWTPAIRTSLYGQYTSWQPGSTGNLIMCSSPQAPVRTLGNAAPTGAAALAGCDFSFNLWAVGSRTVWNPVKNLDIGVEVMYTELDQKMDPTRILMNSGGGGGRAAGLYAPANEGVLQGLLRVQRNFWP